jgi:saccharopine dehydrogenase (NAD+, L-lysine-forming)
VRWVAPAFDHLESAIVSSVMKQDWAGFDLPDQTVIEMVEEINDFVPLVFKNRQWQKISAWQSMKPQEIDFGEPFGRQACFPMFLEEMRLLPELYPDLQETGFFVGGFNPFVDWIVMPLALVGMRAWPDGTRRPLGKLMRWGLEHFSRPPFGMVLKLTATGSKNNQPKQLDLVLSHPDGYVFTAVPVTACLLQLLDGSIRKPGLWTQANLVEPGRFLLDMERMGIEVQCSGSTGRRVT